MKARARALAGLIGLGAAVPAAAEPPLCRASVGLEPAEAFVGQAVGYHVRIEQRRDVVDLRWEESLSFPAMRAEWIPTLTGPGASEATLLVDERRVLFPARAGRLALPGARLACEGAGRVESVNVPASALVVREPPAEGRPPDWNGLVGPVEVSSFATPDRVSLGGSVSLSVTVRGAGNVWTTPTPFAGAFAPDAAELFERPAELARDTGRRLELRQYYSFDLVPRRAGTLAIPEVRVAYFDPEARRYAESRAPALEIQVSERPGGVGAAATPADEPPSPPPAPPGGLAMATVAALAGLTGAVLGAWLGRRRSRLTPSRGRVPRDAQREALVALRGAIASGDAAAAASAAARGLRLALERHAPGACSRSVEELAANAHADAAQQLVGLLARLEAERYSAAPGDPLALARAAETLLAR